MTGIDRDDLLQEESSITEKIDKEIKKAVSNGVADLSGVWRAVYKVGLPAVVVVLILFGVFYIIRDNAATTKLLVENVIESTKENTKTLTEISTIKQDTRTEVRSIRDEVKEVKGSEASQAVVLSQIQETTKKLADHTERVSQLSQSNAELVVATNRLVQTNTEVLSKQAEVHAKQTEILNTNQEVLKFIQQCLQKKVENSPAGAGGKNGS